MPEQVTTTIPAIRSRIDTHLRRCIPPRQLYWDREAKNYYVRAFDESVPRLGPYAWTQLIGLARHLDAFRRHERDNQFSLQTPRGVYPEEPLKHSLKFQVLTRKLQAAMTLLAKEGYTLPCPDFPKTDQGASDALIWARAHAEATAKVTAPAVPAALPKQPVPWEEPTEADDIDFELD